ncbi:hypothetical protein AMECASPLE_002693 [Ameca splendens]|uniref:Uncharacterized protein n=1 Tax=Ameca splendens TaxID=208324 RepID=A0ABV0XYA4_9TELE
MSHFEDHHVLPSWQFPASFVSWTKLTQTAPKNSSENLSFDNPDSEFLYPWQPDRFHLLLIRLFTFLIV